MNGKIKISIICVCALLVCVGSEKSVPLVPEIKDYDADAEEVRFFNNDLRRQVHATVYKTVNKYYCSLDSIIEGSHLMVYDTRGWTFPEQDVNLTLKYPPVDDTTSFEETKRDYLITGFKVIVFIDGPASKGYIMDGGVLQDTITLSLVSSGLTNLSYQFWLYGVRKDTPGVVEINTHYRLC